MASRKTGLVCRECQCPQCLNCGKRAEEIDCRIAQMGAESYYCEDCRGDHKLKQCKKCEGWKTLSCYPEEVRRAVTKLRSIRNKCHWCSECIENNKEDYNKQEAETMQELR